MEPVELVGELSAIDTELKGVESALYRLQDGTYGRCERCGEAIDQADLAAAPLLRACLEHRSEH